MRLVALEDIRRDISLVAGEKALAYIDQQGKAIEALTLEQDIVRRQLVFLTKELAELRVKLLLMSGVA